MRINKNNLLAYFTTDESKLPESYVKESKNFLKYSRILKFFNSIIDNKNEHFEKRYYCIKKYNELATQCGLKPRPENKIETF
jgi:hypothetical protein|tara:strand:- start:204 stop:449 length:246 start_codon:yes stop_codon:yes gene_type:complete